MAFTKSGDVITQANEAGKHISIVASHASGIECTCTAHGYAVGDLVEITGITAYNGVYDILAVTTNTFVVDAEFSVDAAGTVARGDKDLSGMETIDQNTIAVSAGADKKTFYEIYNDVVNITGNVRINPEIEQLVTEDEAPYKTINVKPSGRLILGKEITSNGYTRRTKGVALYLGRATPASQGFRDDTHSGLFVEGALEVYGATISTHLATGFMASSSIKIRDGVIDMSRALTTDNLQLRCRASCDIDGLTVIGGLVTWLNTTDHIQLKNYRPTHTFESNVISGRTANDTLLLDGYDGRGSGVDATLLNPSFQQPVFRNAVVGTEIIVNGHGGGTNRSGVVRVSKEMVVRLKDSAGNAISDAVLFIRDTNNGQRRNSTTTSENFTNDRTHYAVFNAHGETAIIDVLTGAVVSNAQSDGVAGGHTDGEGTGSYRWDRRSKNDDNTDTFDIFIWAYGYLPAVITTELKGSGVKYVDWTLFEDTSVTESTASVAGAYADISVNKTTKVITLGSEITLEQLYDYLKYYKILQPNIETPTVGTSILSVAGKTLTMNDGWTVSGAQYLRRTDKFDTLVSTSQITFDDDVNTSDIYYRDSLGGNIIINSLVNGAQLRVYRHDAEDATTQLLSAENANQSLSVRLRTGEAVQVIQKDAGLSLFNQQYSYQYHVNTTISLVEEAVRGFSFSSTALAALSGLSYNSDDDQLELTESLTWQNVIGLLEKIIEANLDTFPQIGDLYTFTDNVLTLKKNLVQSGNGDIIGFDSINLGANTLTGSISIPYKDSTGVSLQCTGIVEGGKVLLDVTDESNDRAVQVVPANGIVTFRVPADTMMTFYIIAKGYIKQTATIDSGDGISRAISLEKIINPIDGTDAYGNGTSDTQKAGITLVGTTITVASISDKYGKANVFDKLVELDNADANLKATQIVTRFDELTLYVSATYTIKRVAGNAIPIFTFISWYDNTQTDAISNLVAEFVKTEVAPIKIAPTALSLQEFGNSVVNQLQADGSKLADLHDVEFRDEVLIDAANALVASKSDAIGFAKLNDAGTQIIRKKAKTSVDVPINPDDDHAVKYDTEKV